MTEEPVTTMTQVSMPIPEDLRELVEYVHELIEMEDDDATMRSDDLIQHECGSAGLVDPERGMFLISYFGSGQRWEFRLTTTQIDMVAKGHISTLPLWRCNSCGRCFGDESHSCVARSRD